MTSKADYLKKYMSIGDQEKKKKKKKKENNGQPQRLRLIEEDAFLSVEAAKARDIGSDEEQEEIEVLKQSAKKAKVVHGFKQSFAQVETPKEIKEEPLSPSSSPPNNSRATSNRKRHDSDSDNSPPRPARRRHDSDNSPPRPARRRHDSDNSPPRPARRRHDSDNSPPRPSRRRHDSDNSPPRPSRRRHDSDNSPPRTRHDADEDNSPVRRRQSSPPSRNRRGRHDSDNSPPRQRARQDDRDSSPPRRRKHHDDDLSPPRKSRRVEEPKMIKKEEPDDDGEYGKTLEGKKSGLQSAKDLKEESDKLKAKNAKMFEDMDTSVSGRFADTVYRQKQTKRKGRDAEEDREKKEREAKKTEELKEKYKDWNKGVAQIEERKAQLEEMARVAAEPMARARDDDAMNAHLKEVLHAADPMANLIQKKRRDIAIDRGELVYPTYQGHWVPNRFGIAPGYRWDGVDRSNGFEGKLAKTANTKAANQSEYYKSIAEYE